MSSNVATAASPADTLCESCGYTLNGLPADGNCPECGTAVAISTTRSGRALPVWETDRRFWETTRLVVFRTNIFYRTLMTRVPAASHRAAYAFAMRHWVLAGLLVALASGLHYTLTQAPARVQAMDARVGLVFLWVAVVTGFFTFAAMGVTHLAAWLTAWEAGWRGYRLPYDIVLRGLCYHAAHLLPVAAAALLMVGVYRVLWMTGVVGYESLVAYLVVLSLITVLGAFYLFWTYWIGMKNMLYANQ